MPITYSDAGVDVQAGNELVSRLKSVMPSSQSSGLLTGHGGFAALSRVPSKFEQPVMALGTDSVGTKLELLINHNRLDTAGQDLVAMCANDVLVYGAEPHLFLDYFATGRLDINEAEVVVKSVSVACDMAGCALAGGETAEMPGFYPEGKFDLAGFCIGWVDEARVLYPHRVQEGDMLLGIASSGPHSNGYTLIRKLVSQCETELDTEILEALLTPTRIYPKSILPWIDRIHALAHITGGGLRDNLPRSFPDSFAAHIDLASWQQPEVFNWIKEQAQIDDAEMLSTFNCGIGMVVILPPNHVDEVKQGLAETGETTFVLGSMMSTQESAKSESLVISKGCFELT